MATIRPFKGLRPLPELAAKIAALPYDVMDTKEAAAEIAKEPLSFLTVTKSEATMPEGTDPYAPSVYETAKINLQLYKETGAMEQDSAPCYYIYRQQMQHHIQIGLVAVASVKEYQQGIIKKHELTRVDKEEDRVRHILATQAQTGAVFLTYKNSEEITAHLLSMMSNRKAAYDFKSEDGVQHTLYVVTNPIDQKEITHLFAQVPVLYIADGHHRSAAAARVADILSGDGTAESDFFLTVIFSDKMMQIIDYNRLVKDLHDMTPEAFLAALLADFTVTKTERFDKPTAQHTFAMYLDGQSYLLQAKEGSFDAEDPIDALDVQILQSKVLTPLLGIEDVRTDKRIDFMGGIRGIKALQQKVDSKEYRLAFAMYPTSIAELFKVADAGKIMPPKSTWFEPKLRDAMVVHLIGDEL